MNDVRLFKIDSQNAEELGGYFVNRERDLQAIMEKHLECLLGIKFLAHEYGLGKLNRGHIDTLGIDENLCPVIIEYKRRNNENIITQGLYYLDWLLDHQSEFEILAREKLGTACEGKIEFSGCRVLCVASGFGRYDEGAIRQIGQRVELVRYKFFAENLLMLELAKKPLDSALVKIADGSPENACADIGMPLAMQMRLKSMTPATEDLYIRLLSFAETLGDDVCIKFLKHYIAFMRVKNFTAVQPMKNLLKLWLNLDPAEFTLEEGFSRDVREIGHHSSGNLEIDIHCNEDLEKAKHFIELAYQRN